MRRAEPVDAHLGELLDRNMVAEVRPPARYRAVRVVNVLIGLVATSFVLTLGAHIGLAFAGAETGNPVGRFITAFADAVDLGVHNAVSMGNRPLQVGADDGIAALLWVFIGALVTTLIDRVFLPHEHQRRQRRARRTRFDPRGRGLSGGHHGQVAQALPRGRRHGRTAPSARRLRPRRQH